MNNDFVKVDPEYFWQDMTSCPSGVKVQLLNRAGIATTGKVAGNKDGWWIAWCPLPKIPPHIKEMIK